jgi:hypothetical protein
VHHPKKLSASIFASLLVFLFALPATAQNRPASEAARNKPENVRTATKLLPERIGDFKAAGGQATVELYAGDAAPFDPRAFEVNSVAERAYTGAQGEKLIVKAVRTASPAAAYSLLRRLSLGVGRVRLLDGLGLVGTVEGDRLRFVKGAVLVEVAAAEGAQGPDSVRAFAGLYAEGIEGEPGYIPVLLLHLPEWEKKIEEEAGYAVTLPALQGFAGARPALEAVSFEGGAEAATALYGNTRLVLVEFPTPQLSIESDARINERIAQLRAAGQPVPSFYQRIGNYSVFVFDAPDEEAARELASGVAYEKDVRWLGRNPHEDEIVQRLYTRTMGGVIVTTLATTGVAILICLGAGGLIGGAVFMYRRSRPEAREAYSDAGGMMRLNLEEFDAAGSTPNLLGPKND